MIHRALYAELKRIFTSNISSELLPGFVESSVEEKVEVIRELISKNYTPYLIGVGEQQIRGYLLILHLALELAKPNTPQLYELRSALGIPVVTGWPKANPPQSQFDLLNDKRQPNWAEEVNQAAAAANLLGFESAGNLDDIQAAVKTTLGVGGMEDSGDERVIAKTDKTLNLFVDYVKYQLKVIRPEWFDVSGELLKKLPKELDPRPQYVLDAEKGLEEEERRAKLKRKAELDRREKTQAEYGKRKKAVFDLLDKQDITLFVAQSVTSGFEAFKTLVKEKTKTNSPSWIPAAVLDVVAKSIPVEEEPGDKAAAQRIIAEKLKFIEQYLLAAVSKVKPGWFRSMANGDLGLRKKEKVAGLSRAERIIFLRLNKLFEKYGASELGRCVLAVYAVKKTPEEAFGPLPTMSAIVLKKKPVQ